MLTLIAGIAFARTSLERLDIGFASSTRIGEPVYVAQPFEASVSTFVTPWLAFEGRLGLTPSWWHGYDFYLYPDDHFRGVATAGVRFGHTSGIYGGFSVGAYLPEPVHHPDHPDLDPVVSGWGGWRFKLGKQAYIAPEVFVGTFYGGAGVHLEWVALRR